MHLHVRKPVLSLTRQANLDRLAIDDRISTGRIDPSTRIDPDPLLQVCGEFADAVFDWWNGHPPPILYRSRTTPTFGRNIAFTDKTDYAVLDAKPLHEATALLASLVLRAGFEVPSPWLR